MLTKQNTSFCRNVESRRMSRTCLRLVLSKSLKADQGIRYGIHIRNFHVLHRKLQRVQCQAACRSLWFMPTESFISSSERLFKKVFRLVTHWAMLISTTSLASFHHLFVWNVWNLEIGGIFSQGIAAKVSEQKIIIAWTNVQNLFNLLRQDLRRRQWWSFLFAKVRGSGE